MKQTEVFPRSAGPFLKNGFMPLTLKNLQLFCGEDKASWKLTVGIQSSLCKGEQGKNLPCVENAAISH